MENRLIEMDRRNVAVTLRLSGEPALFSAEFVEPRELLESQAITGPQGLAALGDVDWEDDEEGDRFLDYVLDRS